MKSLIAMILLAATFMGGYYLGHQPGAPDIFAEAQKAYAQASQAANKLSIPAMPQAAPQAQPAAGTHAPQRTQVAAASQAPQHTQVAAVSQAPVPARTPVVSAPVAVIEIGGKLYQVGVQVQ